jgi:CheY-like chemotaxis protein
VNRPGNEGPTVLVVDDEPDVRAVATFMLRRAGYPTLEAANGQEAVGIVGERRSQISAVLLDVMMPVMTGHETLPALREIVPGLPVVLCSGYDRNEVADHLVDPGAYTAFLAKPFTQSELVEEIRGALAAD